LTAPTAEQLTETLTHAIHIAGRVVDDYEWIRADADLPPGRNPDRPTRLRPSGDGDPDHVPGERWALGVGNDQARAAYERADVLAQDAHHQATMAVARMHELRGRLPRRVRRPDRFGFAEVVWSTARRLQWLLDDGSATIDDTEARKRAHAAAVQLQQAHAALRAVLRDVDGTGEPDAARRCNNCGDPCPPGWTRKECDKCRRYRQRTGRPRLIRRHADAYKARDRRKIRGEDHAANPAPKGRYVYGEWVPAAPHPDREAS
jgi:hypothetical protein